MLHAKVILIEHITLQAVFFIVLIVIIFQIKALHLYDCLRANKSTSAWGVEARVPFLDKEFINIAMSIDPEWKMVKDLVFIISFLFYYLIHVHAVTEQNKR